MNYRPLTDSVFVGGQVMAADMAALVEQGIKTLINNRPDNEMPGQPTGAELAIKAKAAGLDYIHLPMAGGLTLDLVEGSSSAYNDLPMPALAFCASGTRSVVLWCFASVKDNGVDSVLQTARDAGYDLSHMRGGLEQYASE